MSDHKDKSGFIPGGQVLTNLEDYSLRVRSEADAYAKEVHSEIARLKEISQAELDAAAKKKLRLEDEAAEVLAKAKEEAETLLEKSQQEGFDKGYAIAEEKFFAEIDQRLQDLASVLATIKNYRDQLFIKYEKELLDLCLLTAQKIVVAELKTSKNMVLASLTQAVKKLAGQGKVKINLNPTDYDYILERSKEIHHYLEEGQPLVLMPDEAVNAGKVKIESDFSTIDLDIKKQFSRLAVLMDEMFEKRANAYSKNQLSD